VALCVAKAVLKELSVTEGAGNEAAERVCVGAISRAATAGLAAITPAAATPRIIALDFNMTFRLDYRLPTFLAL